MVQLIRLFDVMTPGNLNAFTNFFEKVTSVQLIDTEEYFNDLVYTPEFDPLSLNF